MEERQNKRVQESASGSESLGCTSSGSIETLKGLGEYLIKGQIRLSIWYEDCPQLLIVQVDEAEGLVGVKSGGYSDPYVKIHLLPEHTELLDKDKNVSRKTNVKMGTNNPKYVEYFEYVLSKEELHEKILWLTVWDFVENGIDLFLGEVCLQLSKIKFTGHSQGWYHLKKWYSPVVGELTVGLLLESSILESDNDRKNLHVILKGAQSIQNFEYTQFFAKVILQPDMFEKASEPVKADPNPVWNEEFIYKNVLLEKLSSTIVLEVLLFGITNSNFVEFIGGLRIGPSQDVNSPKEWMDSRVEETDHWENMLSSPGVLVETCHTLRPTMKYGAHTDGIELSGLRDDIILDQVAIKLSRIRGTQSSGNDFRTNNLVGPVSQSLDKLQKQSSDEMETGLLSVSLMIEECPNSVYKNHVKVCVIIGAGENIPCEDYSHIFASIVLLPGTADKMTKMVEASPFLEWDELFVFDNVSLDKLYSHRVIEIKLFGRTSSTSAIKQIGGLRLGPLQNPGFTPPWVDSKEEEAKHWEEMLLCPNNWTDYCHVLRSSVDYEDFVDVMSLAFKEDNIDELEDKNTSSSKTTSALAYLNLGLKYEYNQAADESPSSTLHVRIDSAVFQKKRKGKYFVKIRCLPFKGSSRRTKEVTYKDIAEWNEEFEYFEINKEHLRFKYVVEVTLWKVRSSKKSKKPDFVGALHVGPAPRPGCTPKYVDTTEREFSHWEKMATNPYSWVKACHLLRNSIEFRKISDILLQEAVKEREILMKEARV